MKQDSIAFAYEELKNCFADYSNSPKVDLTLDNSLSAQEYCINGDGSTYTISGGSEIGVLYGTYTLLNNLGFYWFSPDAWDEERPAELHLQPLHLREKPSFDIRGFFAVEKRDSREFLLWMMRNKMNLWTASTSEPQLCDCGKFYLRGNPPKGSHRICSDFLPPKTYFEDHPDWYALIDGKRRANMPEDDVADNICFSNDEGCQALAENLAASLNGGTLSTANTVSVWPFDNGIWCQCDECRKLGNKTSQFLHFVYICQKVLAKSVSRKITLIIPAYHETLPIPDKPLPADFDYSSVLVEYFPIERCYAHHIDDSQCFANNVLNDRFRQWVDNTSFNVIVCEYYNVSLFASMAFPLAIDMPHDLKYYNDNHVTAMNYMHVSTALWGELAFNNWSFAALLWNTEADISRFYELRYHAVASVMRRFYETLWHATRNCKLLKHYQGVSFKEDGRLKNFGLDFRISNLKEEETPLFPPDHLAYDKDDGELPSLLGTLKLMDEAKSLLKQAMRECGDDEILSQRLMMDMCRFSYTHDYMRFLEAFVRLRLKERAGEDASQDAKELQKYGERLRQETQMVQYIRAEGAPNLSLYLNGLTVTRMQDGYAAVMQRYNLEVAPWQPGELRNVVQG